MDFDSLDTKLIETFKTDISLSRKIGLEIYNLALSDPVFAEELKKNYDRIFFNMTFLVESKKKILIFTDGNNRTGEWDHDSIKTGIHGSEEAIIYASTELVKYGYQVDICGFPNKISIWTLPLSNPRYVHIEKGIDEKYDAVIMWRRTDFKLASVITDKVYFWPHDICCNVISEDSMEKLNGIFFLSEYQKNDYFNKNPHLAKKDYVISGNGIIPDEFPDEPEDKINPYSCVYISNYMRGLDLLLNIWPEVRKNFPRATLGVYYGREIWGSGDPSKLISIVEKMEGLKYSGVTEYGKVGHDVLAKALIKTSILAYPCTSLAETYCISVVKAQSAGCIPIVIKVGALKETVHPDAPAIESIDIENYKNLLLSNLKRVSEAEDDLIEERKKYISFGKEKTWNKCVKKWLELIEK